jgi:hypothetical protein
MPPVSLTGDIGSGGSVLFNVTARHVDDDATLAVTFSYDVRTSVAATFRTFRGVRIDTVELLVVAQRIEQESDGITLPAGAIVVALSAAQLGADAREERFSGSGSIVLPASYFEAEAHLTWTLVRRARGCRDAYGAIGESRVVSAEFLHAALTLNRPFDPRDVQVILDGTANGTRVK